MGNTLTRRFLCLLVPVLALSSPALTQISNSQKQAIHALVQAHIAENHMPGLSLAVVVNGDVALTEGFGLADVENDVPANADSMYRIASVSKSVTAVAAMRLVETGKLDLDAPIQKYCPAFPSKQWTVTTRQLLQHQSGIRDYRNQAETVNTRHYTSINEALGQFANDPLEFEPGTKMQYTSYGYIVLGCVVEGASGEPYANYMQQAIFGRARMSSTRLDNVFAIIPHRARGYELDASGNPQNAVFVDVSNKPPGSGINSSARDMGAFIAALYNQQLVSSSSLRQMLTAAKTRDGKDTIYGLGFFVGGPMGNYRGFGEAGHGGDQQGFSSILYLLPQKKFGVVALTNLESKDISLKLIGLSRKIFDICASR